MVESKAEEENQFEMVAALHILNTGKEQTRIYGESFTKEGAFKECKAIIHL